MDIESSAVLRSCRSHCIQHNHPLPQLGILQWVIFNPFYIWWFYSVCMLLITSFFRVLQSRTLPNSTKRTVGAAILTFPKAYTLCTRCINDNGCLNQTTETLKKTTWMIYSYIILKLSKLRVVPVCPFPFHAGFPLYLQGSSNKIITWTAASTCLSSSHSQLFVYHDYWSSFTKQCLTVASNPAAKIKIVTKNK